MLKISVAEWVRALIVSVLNLSSSHRCGFESNSCMIWNSIVSVPDHCIFIYFADGQVFFLGDLPFLPRIPTDLFQNELNNLDEQ